MEQDAVGRDLTLNAASAELIVLDVITPRQGRSQPGPVEAAEGCDLLILLLPLSKRTAEMGRYSLNTKPPAIHPWSPRKV